MSGKSYMQEQKKVNFECDAEQELEHHHNLITENEPDEGQSKEYSPSDAMLMARLIYNLNTRVVREGASFAQQYLLNKGLKIFGQKGRDASKKEMEQLHRRSCFTPKSITILRSGILPHSTNSTYASFNLISSPSVRYLRTRFFSLLLNCRP
jgi:hypothetical protein